MIPRISCAVALSCLLFAPAWAGDLDGAWRRDDKKVYVIVDDEGLELPLQDYSSRFTIKRDKGALEWTLRFTRTADEANDFETTAKTTGKVVPGSKKLEMEFGYVDLDEEEGKIIRRGTEKHTLVLEEALTPEQSASIKKALRSTGRSTISSRRRTCPAHLRRRTPPRTSPASSRAAARSRRSLCPRKRTRRPRPGTSRSAASSSRPRRATGRSTT